MHEFDLTAPAEPFEERGTLGVAHPHTYVHPLSGQGLHDLATEESGSSEYGYTFGCHRFSLPRIEAYPERPLSLCRTPHIESHRAQGKLNLPPNRSWPHHTPTVALPVCVGDERTTLIPWTRAL